MTGIERIAAERQRQIAQEGWTAEHDAQHTGGDIAVAAACYAIPLNLREMKKYAYEPHTIPKYWPWKAEWWKPNPGNRIRELEKAGALIAAEIDRLQAEQAAKRSE